jgi:hypothetical protein
MHEDCLDLDHDTGNDFKINLGQVLGNDLENTSSDGREHT